MNFAIQGNPPPWTVLGASGQKLFYTHCTGYGLYFSKLFYCSTTWSGTFKQNFKKLKLIKNLAARILTDARHSDKLSPLLIELDWITVKDARYYHDL